MLFNNKSIITKTQQQKGLLITYTKIGHVISTQGAHDGSSILIISYLQSVNTGCMLTCVHVHYLVDFLLLQCTFLLVRSVYSSQDSACCMLVLSSPSNRSQVTVKDIEKYGPVLRAGVRSHNDVKKKYDEISFEAFVKYEQQASLKGCKDVFQVKCSLVISAILFDFSYLL